MFYINVNWLDHNYMCYFIVTGIRARSSHTCQRGGVEIFNRTKQDGAGESHRTLQYWSHKVQGNGGGHWTQHFAGNGHSRTWFAGL